MSDEPRRPEQLFDLITFVMVIGAVLILGASLVIVANPNVPFNPLPPATLPPMLAIPSATPSPTASNTFTPTLTPSPTLSPTPTQTFTPSSTPTETLSPSPSPTVTTSPSPTASFTPVLPGLPSNTPLPTATTDPATPISADGLPAQAGIVIVTNPPPLAPDQNAAFPFVANAPRILANPDTCDSLIVGGTVTGMLGEPLPNIVIEISGEGFSEIRFSGTAPRWGQSGFEVEVGNQPQARQFALRILGSAGEALSEYQAITTGNTCNSNITLVDFTQVREY